MLEENRQLKIAESEEELKQLPALLRGDIAKVGKEESQPLPKVCNPMFLFN